MEGKGLSVCLFLCKRRKRVWERLSWGGGVTELTNGELSGRKKSACMSVCVNEKNSLVGWGGGEGERDRGKENQLDPQEFESLKSHFLLSLLLHK